MVEESGKTWKQNLLIINLSTIFVYNSFDSVAQFSSYGFFSNVGAS